MVNELTTTAKKFLKANASILSNSKEGDFIDVKPLELLQVFPEKDFKGNPYTGKPLLYLICVAQNGEKLKAKIKMTEFLEYVAARGNMNFPVEVMVNVHKEETRFATVERKFLTVEKWG